MHHTLEACLKPLKAYLTEYSCKVRSGNGGLTEDRINYKGHNVSQTTHVKQLR